MARTDGLGDQAHRRHHVAVESGLTVTETGQEIGHGGTRWERCGCRRPNWGGVRRGDPRPERRSVRAEGVQLEELPDTDRLRRRPVDDDLTLVNLATVGTDVAAGVELGDPPLIRCQLPRSPLVVPADHTGAERAGVTTTTDDR